MPRRQIRRVHPVDEGIALLGELTALRVLVEELILRRDTPVDRLLSLVEQGFDKLDFSDASTKVDYCLGAQRAIDSLKKLAQTGDADADMDSRN